MTGKSAPRTGVVWTVGAFVIGALALIAAGCSAGSSDSTAPPVLEQFTGDAASAFCELTRASDREPFQDPFEAGLTPLEVRTRFRAVEQRFGALADAAPVELADGLAQVVAALDEFGAELDAANFDLAALADRGVDEALFDDPAFAEIGARVDAYQSQVCRSR